MERWGGKRRAQIQLYLAIRISAASGEKLPAVYCTTLRVAKLNRRLLWHIDQYFFSRKKVRRWKRKVYKVPLGYKVEQQQKQHFICIPPKRKLLKNCLDWWSRSFSQTECRFVFEFVGSTRYVSGSKLWVYPPKGKFSVGVQFISLKLISSLMEENVWFKNTG